MYIIPIDNEIHEFLISVDYIKYHLRQAAGDDVQFDIFSIGGSFFQGMEIHNIIKSYSGETTAVLGAQVASIASYIPIACDKVIVHPNTSYMMHNANLKVEGDFNRLRTFADLLERFSGIMADEYSKKSGKTLEQIKKIMSAETWYIGQEIIDNGFADEMIAGEGEIKSKDELIITAMANFKASAEKRKFDNINIENINQLAAKLKIEDIPKNKTTQTLEIKAKGEKKIMNLQELKVQHPELVKEIQVEAKAKELKRVKAHLKFIGSSKDEVVKNIEAGSSFMDEEVQAGYLQNQMKAKYIANATGENTTGVNSDNDATPETKTDAEVRAAAQKDKYDDASPENVEKFLNGEL